jgi:hypothetical protein
MIRARRSIRPQVEAVESRALLSAMPAAGHAIDVQGQLRVLLTVVANPTTDAVSSVTGTESGNIAPLGTIFKSVSIKNPKIPPNPPPIPVGNINGPLTLKNATGSITMDVHQQGASIHRFNFVVTGGTGPFQGASGSGTMFVQERIGIQRQGKDLAVTLTGVFNFRG